MPPVSPSSDPSPPPRADGPRVASASPVARKPEEDGAPRPIAGMSMRDSKPGRCIPRGHGRGRTVAGARSSEPRSDRTYRGAARFQPRCSRTRRARGHGRRASVCGSRMMIRCRTQRAMERTGPRGADPRRGTSRFGAGSRTRHGTQWASEAQDPAVPILDEGRLDSARARGPDMGLSGRRRHRPPAAPIDSARASGPDRHSGASERS